MPQNPKDIWNEIFQMFAPQATNLPPQPFPPELLQQSHLKYLTQSPKEYSMPQFSRIYNELWKRLGRSPNAHEFGDFFDKVAKGAISFDPSVALNFIPQSFLNQMLQFLSGPQS